MAKPQCQDLPSAAPKVIWSNIPFLLETLNKPNWNNGLSSPSAGLQMRRTITPFGLPQFPRAGDVLGSWLDSSVLGCCGPCPCPVSPVPVPALFWPLMPADLNPSDAPRDPPDSCGCSPLEPAPKPIHVPGSHSEIALSEKRLV